MSHADALNDEINWTHDLKALSLLKDRIRKDYVFERLTQDEWKLLEEKINHKWNKITVP